MKFASSSFLAVAAISGATAFVAQKPSTLSMPSTSTIGKNVVRNTPFSTPSSLEMANGEVVGFASAAASDYEALGLPAREGRPIKVAIAGGGVGGLTAALCMLKKGFDVTVYEKTAAFARFGGPIQFASNALSVLKEIDNELFDRVMEKFTFTGTRACGIKDGKKKYAEMETMEMGGRQWD